MPFISSELVSSTWQTVGASNDKQIRRLQARHDGTQRALGRFVYDEFLKFREEAAGGGIYVYHVVLEMFMQVRPGLKRVRRAQLEQVLADLSAAGENSPAKAIEQSPEPHALRYVHEALYQDQGDVALSEDEGERIFRFMQVAISRSRRHPGTDERLFQGVTRAFLAVGRQSRAP
jgi:hypothetical protein